MNGSQLNDKEKADLYGSVRDAVDQELRSRNLPKTTKQAWAALVYTDTIPFLLDAWDDPDGDVDACFDDLVNQYMAIKEQLRSSRTPRVTRPDEIAFVGYASTEGTPRERAVSVLVADLVSDDPQLRHFRRQHLPHGLLAADEVEQWVTARSREEPLRPEDDSLKAHHYLEYGVPGDPIMRRPRIRPGGLLAELQTLGEHLSGSWRWQPAQAVTFILAGAVPLMRTVQIKGSMGRVPATARITLVVDPTLSPEDLAEAYRRARNAPFFGLEGFQRQCDRLNELALFMRDNPDREPEDLLQRWNAAHDEKSRYKNADDLVTIARQAKDHLLYHKQRRPRRKKRAKES